ncbi:hypothetical protein B0T26DRAFT_755252 [Lasiosphaeria miniovina]|uniref:Ubiquitin 3 binding protein But2 C-terminal domain-containing protein n=1 Tax=Lasiosphaeria miniovina TaxID=1954250 RepID=A0AA40A6D4_9PEZI|nr:uncharacterized protein B0T26DRAFT_755252 [Lasiosphaeria miniovina]KAK0710141.1 hypothetical protein B0T26DRAFT_755252 [Lasiosphaeria miniovina]
MRIPIAALVLGSQATAALKPWEISALRTFSPSGRPDSSPWSFINLTIADRNTYAATAPPPDASAPGIAATCFVQWPYAGDAYGREVNCTTTTTTTTPLSSSPPPEWTLTMLPTPGSAYASPLNDFMLRLTLTLKFAGAEDKYEGSARFALGPGQNLQGICSASGVCAFALRDEAVPVLVLQTRVAGGLLG